MPNDRVLEVDDLAAALAPEADETLVAAGMTPEAIDPATQRLLSAVRRAGAVGEVDLNVTDEADLLQADVAQLARLCWVGSYLRLWDFLKRQPKDFAEASVQTAHGLSFMRHAERTEAPFRAMLLGRRQGDEALAEEVEQLRGKSRLLVEKQISIRTRTTRTVTSPTPLVIDAPPQD